MHASNHSIHRQIPLSLRIISTFGFIIQHAFPSSARLERWRQKVANIVAAHLGQSDSYRENKKSRILEVDRRVNLTSKEFVRNYLNPGIPVIFSQEAIKWECTKKWGLDFLKSTYPNEEFSLIDSKGLVEDEYDRSQGKDRPVLVDKMRASDFVDAVRNGEKTYLRFCPIMETHPELADDLDETWFKKFRRCFLGISYQSFIGPSGRKTPLHSETTAFFYVMADGEKKWTLFSPTAFPLINPSLEGRGYNYSKVNVENPDLNIFPGFDHLLRYQCVIKKGDILFVPAWMWHEVDNLTEGWGLSYRFTSLRGFLRHPAFFIVRLFFTHPSFFEIFYYSFFRSDISKRQKNLLTPKIYLKK